MLYNAWDTVTDKVMIVFSIILPFLLIASLVLALLGAVIWPATCLMYIFAIILLAFFGSVDWHRSEKGRCKRWVDSL